MARCKFCGKNIDTDHYFITKHGTCCLECKDKVKEILKGIVGVKKGELHESNSRSNIRSIDRLGTNEKQQKEIVRWEY